MSISTLLFTYLLGGLTFLPLVLLAILVPAWRVLPTVEDEKRRTGALEKEIDGKKKEAGGDKTTADVEKAGSSGTFAVTRKYDLPAALAALNARTHPGNSTGAAGTDNHGETGHGSESVYQSMYRSVFDRSKAASSSTSILENEDELSQATASRSGKKSTPANVFYIHLRHGHLMLYDSSAEREVRHVISLAHYTLSLSAGPAEPDERDIKDGELFIKRTAIVLTPITQNDFFSNEARAQSSIQTKPFYLFSSTCIEKEDFYHALLATSDPHPTPQPLNTDAVIKMQSMLHSNSALTPETRALNALVSRIFLALHKTDRLKALIRNKIEKKISRVQKPAFIASLAVQSIDLGDAAPVLSNLHLKDLNINGDMTIAFDVKYIGGIKFTFAALAKLDLGPRFKTRTADLLLSTSLQRLQGRMLIRIKPTPSNRLWFCFEAMPDMDIKVEPVVSQRQITYTFILRAIEDRIRGVVGETLVKPNWDDVPFWDTRDRRWRGGIWTDESEEDVSPQSPPSDLRKRHQKTMSMPSLGIVAGEAESSATSSGSEGISKAATSSLEAPGSGDLKRRSVNSLPLQSTPERDLRTGTPMPLKAAKSPTLTTPPATAPSIQLDQNPANVDPSRGDSEKDQSQQQRKWRILPSLPSQGAKRDAIESIRAMRQRAMAGHAAEEEQHGVEDDEHGGLTAEPSEMDGDGRRRSSESFAPSFADRSVRSTKRADTNASTSTSSSTRSQRQQEAAQKGKNLLAATAAATTAATAAAKTWSWNSLATRKGGPGSGRGQNQEPVGRGQPLPPPGMPLPGPQKGWLPSGMGSVKRKPVLPPRTTVVESPNEVNQTNAPQPGEHEPHPSKHVAEDVLHTSEAVGTSNSEFGPWRENSGARPGSENDYTLDPVDDNAEPHVPHSDVGDSPAAEEEQATPSKKLPPPLPARRPKSAGDMNPLSSVADAEPGYGFNVRGAGDTNEGPPPPGPKDVVDGEDAGEENESVIEKPTAPTDLHMSDEEDLIAIPAPADDSADEAQLEAEGVQQHDSPSAPADSDHSVAEREEASQGARHVEDDGGYRYGSRHGLDGDVTFT